MKLGLEHSYAALPSRFHADVTPTPVKAPRVLVYNTQLAEFLGLEGRLADEAASMLSGNTLPEDAHPLAMAYAGHQFAHFVPQLGDGRAILLGERRARDGRLYDIQLKGAGRTPFSRTGDGRAATGPMLREYLISEALHALGIPTTRSLAVVATGEQVFREEVLPGAVLTRVAASHLRVGTFEFFAARADADALRELLYFAIARHDPELLGSEHRALAFLRHVVERQAALLAQWLAVGFIHGVMNTDNMAVSGETIDYGPCAFMDHYDPQTVFSSIDHRGRYAYGNQPAIAQWNLARLAETLLPLIGGDERLAIDRATAEVQAFTVSFDLQFMQRMRAKLGLGAVREEDSALIQSLLSLMHQARADFTLTFRHLGDAARGRQHEAELRGTLGNSAALEDWLARWRARLALVPMDAEARSAAMQTVNPAFIPRNHRVEAALNAASDRGDLGPFNALLGVVQRPFEDQPGQADLKLPPGDDERVLATFCGT